MLDTELRDDLLAYLADLIACDPAATTAILLNQIPANDRLLQSGHIYQHSQLPTVRGIEVLAGFLTWPDHVREVCDGMPIFYPYGKEDGYRGVLSDGTRLPLPPAVPPYHPERVVKALGYLNTLVSLDRDAMETLVEARYPANEALRAHPTCVLWKSNNQGTGMTVVGFLGLFGGLLGVNPKPTKLGPNPLVAHYHNGRLSGFGPNDTDD